MPEALRLLLMIFTAPLRGLREARDRSPLLPALALAFGANLAYLVLTQWRYWIAPAGGAYKVARYVLLFNLTLLLLAFVLAPLLIFLAALLDSRRRFRELLREEYTPLVCCLFYAWALACLWTMPLALLEQMTGRRDLTITELLKIMGETQNLLPSAPSALWPRVASLSVALTNISPFFLVWLWLATKEVFRFSWLRSASLVLGGLLLGLPLTGLALPLFAVVLTTPLLAILAFFLLRGYFLTLSNRAQAQADFRQNLEAATLNPADASAHYNLGLVHLRRNQLAEAQESFQKAVEIDPDETDAHFQLGRIARAQSRWADAVRHFEEVVRRDETHAQHEIWRETGATYLSAQQYADARAMLERFLKRRENDPEGLYLLGRAQAGLGEKEAARVALQACIEAVKSAPAYKYRADKRWLQEAQNFLRSLA
jgi:tetratricopeptide (TPR) repeat protein